MRMRFMVMHKVDANMEAGGPPTPQIVQGMGALVQESLKNGVFVTGAGLHRSAKRARITSSAGKASVVTGPYTGGNELVASYAMVKVKSMDDAVLHARRYAEALGNAEVEVGPVVEPWDIGIMPKPEGNLPMQALLLTKGDAAYERGDEAVKAERDAALGALSQSLGNEGSLLLAGALTPSRNGARLSSASAGKRSWVDGPFAESKELIAGFSILERPTLHEAKIWADRYAAILGDNEVDIRTIADD